MAIYLKEAVHDKRKINGYIFTWNAEEQNILNIVVAYQTETKQYIAENYSTTEIENYHNVIVYKINGNKK
jgi:hypothetical protein